MRLQPTASNMPAPVHPPDQLPLPAAPAAWCIYLLEARYEFLRLLRTPAFSLPTLLFPALFYLLFAIVLEAGGKGYARDLLANYLVFGVMGAGLFGFGVSVAIERQHGWLTLKRAQPMPPGAYLFAKTVMAMLFALLIFIELALLATTMAGLVLAPLQWLLLGMSAVLGVLPFCAMGLLLGSVSSGSGAPAIVNVLYLPMAFLSGLWLPLESLPHAVARWAPAWPSYHVAQVALRAVGREGGMTVPAHVGVVAVVTIACLLLARRRLARPGG